MPTIQELEAKIEQVKAELAAVRPSNGHSGPQAPAPAPLKLDLGCGPRKQSGFIGADIRPFPGVDVVCDLATQPWPWPDSSVEEAYSSHSVEHIASKEIDFKLEIDWTNHTHKLTKIVSRPRAHFFNELYRVLRPGGKAVIITPHWCSCRSLGDITHEWPAVSEMFWSYLDKTWRPDNAPHDDFYTCDFTSGYGYSTAAWLHGRNPEFVQDALTRWKEAAQDMMCTLVCRK